MSYSTPESLTEPVAYRDHAGFLHHTADGRRVEGDMALYDAVTVRAMERAAERRGYDRRAAEEREVASYAWPCTGRLGDLACTLRGGHPNGHSYVSREAPDRHTASEARQEDQ